MDYLKLLTESYETERALGIGYQPESRLEYLGNSIFDFTTYDDEMTVLLAGKAVEVCKAITGKTTFEYIENPENYRWYIIMCNMPFFNGRLEWGTSIRGAWWDHKITFQSCGLWDGEKQLCEEMTFTQEEWGDFMQAVISFANDEASNGRG
jgi:hypothetical protein